MINNQYHTVTFNCFICNKIAPNILLRMQSREFNKTLADCLGQCGLMIRVTMKGCG